MMRFLVVCRERDERDVDVLGEVGRAVTCDEEERDDVGDSDPVLCSSRYVSQLRSAVCPQ